LKAIRKKKTGKNGKNFINRELSWLAFNERVLEEAFNTSHPLLERVKFLSICASNLAEFIMIRVAGLQSQVRHNISSEAIDSISPQEQLEKIRSRIEELLNEQQRCWEQLKGRLAQEHIYILSSSEYSNKDKKFLKDYFKEKILSNLKIISADSDKNNQLSFLPNLSSSLVVSVKKDKKDYIAFIPLPAERPGRFIRLPSRKSRRRFALLEDVVHMFIDILIGKKNSPESKVISSGLINIIRDGELELSDKADDIIRSFETALKKRKSGAITAVRITGDITEKLSEFLVKEQGIGKEWIFQNNGFLAMRDVAELYEINRLRLKFPPHHIRFPERIDDYGGDCFAAIEEKDIVVHHPYESFDVVIQFIRQATRDPDVVEIKQTLYRTSSHSPIVQALIEAAEAGKNVTVVVELKARFDEEANMMWGKGLEKAGAKVVYGVSGYKTHTKISLIHRRANNGIKSYVHYGTGNYHSVTAKIYADLSFFTCDPVLCKDADKLFAYMENPEKPPVFEKLSVAPFNLRQQIMSLIKKEKEFALEGKPASIWVKLNSLVDSEIINALYEASSAGVSIDLIVRGICCLKPSVPGLSENIRVKSMVGRFLEHERIICFGNGHKMPSRYAKVFISSADWMPRNMNRRVELMVPIENPTVHEQILNQIMVANLRDQKQSWIMQSDGSYHRATWDGSSLSAHEYFLYNPSLSGRGSALHRAEKRRREEGTERSLAKIAVVDIGSNSIRLVVYDGMKRVPLPIFNEKVLCGLARNMERTGGLDEAGATHAFDALERFMKLIKAMDTGKVYCFATSAVRDAEDGDKFVHEVEKRCGLKVQVLSGSEEALFSAFGVASAFHEADGVIGDLGGGSLELAHIRFSRKGTTEKRSPFPAYSAVGECQSFPIGALRLESAARGKKNKGIEIIDKYIKQFPFKTTLYGKDFFAVGGGPRALAKLHISLTGYPLSILHHYRVKASEFLKTLRMVSSLSPARIRKLPSISPGRVETLSFTALVMERIILTGKPLNVVFSTHGVREGMLFDKLQVDSKGEDGLISGCKDIIDRISPSTNKQWVKYGSALYQWMNLIFTDETEYLTRIRKAACILSWVAWYEHTTYRAEMAFRWVLDAELPALDHWERVFIATALFHRYKSDPVQSIMGEAQKLLSKKWQKRARAIGLAMRLGYHLSGTSADILARAGIAIENKKLILSLSSDDMSLISDDVKKRLDKLANSMKLSSAIKIL